MNELISVIVPVYNVEKYLGECVDSIINQSYRNLEIILVDDGSTDSSGQMCDAYEGLDSRIRVIHKENGGPSSARNVGIEKASGKYISFIDGDDIIAPEMLMRLYMAAVTEKCDVACCDYVIFDELKNLRPIVNQEAGRALTHKEAMELLVSMKRYRFVPWNKLFAIDLFNEIRFPEGRFYEDFWPIYNIFKKDSKVVYVQNQLYYYRVRRESTTRNVFNYKKDYDMVWAIDMVDEDVRTSLPWLKDKWAVAYIYYYLSFINRGIKAGVKLPEEEAFIKKYIDDNMTSIEKNEEGSFARKMQVRIFRKSRGLYRVIYRVLK